MTDTPSTQPFEPPAAAASSTPTPPAETQDATGFTDAEHRTLRSAAMLASAWVSRAERGMFDSIKESFAASKAIAGSPPEVAALVGKVVDELAVFAIFAGKNLLKLKHRSVAMS